MDYPSPHGAHIPESFYSSDPDDPYRRPSSNRNRYTHSVSQTPRIRDVTWISTPDQLTPQTPYPPPSPWVPPQPATSMPSPAFRPPSPIPPSPAPTVGEHMTLDELAFVQDNFVDPYYRPQRPPGLFKSFWKGLKKLSGFHPPPSPSPSFPIPIPNPIPRPSSFGSHAHAHTIDMPVPVPVPVPPRGLSLPSETTQYINPTPSETPTGTGTEDHRNTTPYTSPYARPPTVGASPMPVPMTMPTPPMRASPVPRPPTEIHPTITVVSPSPPMPSSPLPSAMRPPRTATPGLPLRSLSVGHDSVEEGSQTLHEPVYPNVAPAVIPVVRSDDDEDEDDLNDLAVIANANAKRKSQFQFQSQSQSLPQPGGAGGVVIAPPALPGRTSSLASTMTRFRRFLTTLDGLPWLWDEQIADEYVPERNPRSRLRARVRKGAEPSWYNPRPEVVERRAYWAEWDMWAKQSTAALWDGTTSIGGRAGWAGVGAGGGFGGGGGMGRQGQWGGMYPNGYAPVQPVATYPLGYPQAEAMNHPVLP